MPSDQCMVTTRLAVASHITSGTSNLASFRVFSRISESAAASIRKSISSFTLSQSVRTPSTGRKRLADGIRVSTRWATNIKVDNSVVSFCSMPGRNILTATCFPSLSLALCTCAIEAAATGGPKSSNSSLTGCSSSSIRSFSTTFIGKAGRLS